MKWGRGVLSWSVINFLLKVARGRVREILNNIKPLARAKEKFWVAHKRLRGFNFSFCTIAHDDNSTSFKEKKGPAPMFHQWAHGKFKLRA